MPEFILITGGARSGKSNQALQSLPENKQAAFIATAEPTDEDMAGRIRRHRKQRDEEITTIEEPLDLAGAVDRIPAGVHTAVVDCLTVWLGNLMHHDPPLSVNHDRLSTFFDRLEDPPCDLVFVTNEVGMGIIPSEEVSRTFRDVAGRVNQRLAERADRVILMVSGIPVPVSELRYSPDGSAPFS